MKLNKSHFQQSARIELLPLIDVIFLLLIFFIFVMLKMTIPSSIKINLPQTIESQTQAKDILSISINAENQIFINEQSTAIEEIVNRVQKLQNENKRSILIRGDQQADLGIALTILDKLRLAGFNQVAFATKKDN